MAGAPGAPGAAGAAGTSRRPLATALAVALLVASGSADAADLFRRHGAPFRDHGRGGHDRVASAGRHVTLHSPGLTRFVARKRFESGTRLEEIRLDAGLRAEATVVRRRGSLGDVRRLWQRAEGREFDLRLRTGAALADVERILAAPHLGAVTWRVLERHRVALRRHQRERDLAARARALGAEVAGRAARDRQGVAAPRPTGVFDPPPR